jgi:hypothetical protein
MAQGVRRGYDEAARESTRFNETTHHPGWEERVRTCLHVRPVRLTILECRLNKTLHNPKSRVRIDKNKARKARAKTHDAAGGWCVPRTNDQAMRSQKSLRCLPVRVQVWAQDEHGSKAQTHAQGQRKPGPTRQRHRCLCAVACESSHTCVLFLLSKVLIHVVAPGIQKIHTLEDEEILGLVEGFQMLVN